MGGGRHSGVLDLENTKKQTSYFQFGIFPAEARRKEQIDQSLSHKKSNLKGKITKKKAVHVTFL